MSSLFARLKSSTEPQHREIEALIDPMKNFGSVDAYKLHILKTWTFYRPLEAELAALDWAAVGIDFNSRRKTPLLKEDMRFLHIPHSQSEETKATFDRINFDFALGCLYVLEGATLGGQVISRHLMRLRIGPENGGRFFNGYGAKTGEMWKSFKARAADYCVTESQIAEAVRGAISTFGNYRDSMMLEGLCVDAS
jgi:heme oxygenase